MPSTNILTVSGRFKNLARIAAFIDEAAQRAGLNDKAVYAVQMAVDEACSNIIEHAYGGEGNGQIQLTCRSTAAGLQVTIFDQGNPFDPLRIPRLNTAAPLSERKRRGMGLFFIYNLVDRVDYTFNTPQGNRLVLFKSR